MTTIIETNGAETVVLCGELSESELADATQGIAMARITGSVGCTYNDVQVQRLYTSRGYPSTTATQLWLIGGAA